MAGDAYGKRFCPEHPDEPMVLLFNSWACDICDGKKIPKRFIVNLGDTDPDRFVHDFTYFMNAFNAGRSGGGKP